MALGDGRLEQLHGSMSVYCRLICTSQHSIIGDQHRHGLRCAERFCETLLDTDFFDFAVNPWTSGWSNGVRPIHYRELAELGLQVPAYLVTNDAERARSFITEYGEVIVKSTSHHRTIARRFAPEMYEKLELLAYSPAVFQQAILGPDVRIHVVGSECHSLGIETQADDYRYPRGQRVRFFKVTPPKAISALCIAATGHFGLHFSGIDFKVCARTGKWYCLEVNPMPGYSGYDRKLSGAISAALVRLLEAGTAQEVRD
ncbi:hypothetical protein [Nonomuraea sp. NPDC049758]|uniref:ATP-grasp domain-containing protein n=1 Tax=Nonomuraea sp. NPDC049758 TaxID=3154360 RepID=UPI003448A566